jgi:exodeoxyribonuclease V alpha subunit
MNPHSSMNAAIPERRPATEEISGVIERVTFHNEDSGFCVLRVKTKGHREETTVVGEPEQTPLFQSSRENLQITEMLPAS